MKHLLIKVAISAVAAIAAAWVYDSMIAGKGHKTADLVKAGMAWGPTPKVG
jgi:hypothetical protein